MCKRFQKKSLKSIGTACLPDDLQEYATSIADWKMNAVEHEMQQNPKKYPEYARAMEACKTAEAQLMQKWSCGPMELDQLESALSAVGAELAIEMYKRGVMDGGRMYHAFITGELPRKEETP